MKNILILFLYIIISTSIAASDGNYKFQHITIDDGLSNNAVTALLQDSRGFLWIGTVGGLDRYDGINLHSYKTAGPKSNTISNNYINCLYEDSKGNIWIGTNSGGLNVFNWNTGIIEVFRQEADKQNALPDNNVRDIQDDKKGNVWILTVADGLVSCNPADRKFKRFTEDKKGIPLGVVSAFFIDKDGLFWIYSDSKGLLTYEPSDSEGFNNIKGPAGEMIPEVHSIIQDEYGKIWIGTENGIFLYNKKSKTINRLNYEKASRISSVNIVNSLYSDNKGNVWAGTVGGLVKFDVKELTAVIMQNNSSESYSLSNNNVSSMIVDRTGILWAGTNPGGLNKLYIQKKIFDHYSHQPGNPNSLNENTVRGIYEDKNGNIWVATIGGGINFLNTAKGTNKVIKNDPDNPASLSSDQPSCVYVDSKSRLWVGTWKGGLNLCENIYRKIDSGEKISFEIFRRDPNDSRSISDDIVQDIYEDKKGRIWVGTGAGIDLFDETRKTFYRMSDNPDPSKRLLDGRVQSGCILEDRQGNFWVGTWNGLNKIKFSSITSSEFRVEKVITYLKNEDNPNSISDNRIISLYQDKKGNIWAGVYDGGINMIESGYLESDSDSISFKIFTESEGLSNNIVYGLLGDSRDKIWAATNYGLSLLDPVTEKFRVYYQIHGLQSNQFFWGASNKGKSGKMYFGGINGFNVFHPDSLNEIESSNIPPVYIVDFKKFGKTFTFDRNICEIKEIELSYTDNFFSIEFAALDFVEPSKNQYAYKLDGFDKDWIYSGNRNLASYTNLPGGTYTFRVKGTNKDGIWNDTGATLVIKIIPPFWETLWFKILTVIALIGLVLLLIKLKTKSIENTKQMLEIEVEKRTRQLQEEIYEKTAIEENLRESQKKLVELNASKDKFFSIISHDLRSPFSALLGISGLLMDDFDSVDKSELQEFIQAIEKTSRGVYNLLENLLDWSKIQTGRMEYMPKEFSLSVMAEEVKNLLETSAKSKKINLVSNIDESLKVYADMNMINTVLRNLTANAIKFTPANGIIEIAASRRENGVEVSVADSGIGISENDIKKLFRIDTTVTTLGTEGERGTGLGLILCKELVAKNNGEIFVASTIGKGTTFTFILPEKNQ